MMREEIAEIESVWLRTYSNLASIVLVRTDRQNVRKYNRAQARDERTLVLVLLNYDTFEKNCPDS